MNIRDIAIKWFCMLFLMGAVLPAFAQTTSSGNVKHVAFPPSSAERAPPLVMLAMSADHQLFREAYANVDLDGDGLIDSTYKNSIEYYGYFESNQCYVYDSGAELFKPASYADNHYCDNGSHWSGNFMNWASMSRIDVIRKIFYGGYRETDLPDKTLLLRADLRDDAHNFVKVYAGADVNRLVPNSFGVEAGTGNKDFGLTLCSTGHEIRVAKGDHRFWASSSRSQCRWRLERSETYTQHIKVLDAAGKIHDRNPLKATSPNTSLQIRVEACSNPTFNSADCGDYQDGGGTHKPQGLLNVYSERDLLEFGLVAGSYNDNRDGGRLRKNITSFEDEVNPDGTYKRTGGGMVAFMDALKIVAQITGRYTDCPLNASENYENFVANNKCSNWGNPISEIYLETVRYLAGKGNQTAEYNDGGADTVFGAGLATAAWNGDGLLNADNQCSDLFALVLNTSVSSDDKVASNDLGINIGSQLAAISSEDGISGSYIVANNGNQAERGVCTTKNITGLQNVTGLCPDAPKFLSGFDLAGIARYAKHNDLWTGLDGIQNVHTYGVELASDQPSLEIPVSSDGSITLLPACESINKAGIRNQCSIVDFQVLNQNETSGDFLVTWEDSTQGSDYDFDIFGKVSYEINGDKIKITTSGAASAGFKIGFGYTIAGTTQDGVHFHTGHNGYTYKDPTGGLDCSVGCNLARRNGALNVTSRTYDIDLSNSAQTLRNPLFYASKHGGYIDINENGALDPGEWDEENNLNGTRGADGNPDSYFFASNPRVLLNSLGSAFRKILASQQSSGTAPANLANSDGSGGIIVQALYYQSEENRSTNETVSWSGELHAFFVDDNGFFREDDHSQGTRHQLDGYDKDRAFSFKVDPISGVLQIERFELANNSLPYDPGSNPIVSIDLRDARELQTIWSAGEQLSTLSNEADDIIKQRGYSNLVADSGESRHIITWFDKNKNGEIDSLETMAFDEDLASESDSSGNQFSRYMGLSNEDQAKSVINFIRGLDGQPNTRTRKITENIDGTDVQVIKRLGDVVNSTPLIVTAPRSAYDVRFGDDSYTAFSAKYKNRRQVMYVGANDGLLHAFNVGFRQFNADSVLMFSANDPQDNSKAKQPLGAELWAYAPRNLMPHLQWLSEPNYAHVFYVDGEAQSYDVNIFPNDADHPNGWGTILVAGMRLGGNEIALNLDDDDATDNAGAACNDLCTRSAYMVLDITNPEKAPIVLAEITAYDLGFTSQRPALMKKRVRGTGGRTWANPQENEWKLVFGSGPDDLDSITSSIKPRLYVYDLVNNVLEDSAGLEIDNNAAGLEIDNNAAGLENSFVGGLTTVDWDSDYDDDVVYFGTSGYDSSLEDAASNNDGYYGGLYRYVDIGNKPGTSHLLDMKRPVSSKPLTKTVDGENFVYAGSGRFMHDADVGLSSLERYVGVKEARKADGSIDFLATANISNLIDITGVVVKEDGTLDGTTPPGIDTFVDLQSKIVSDPTVSGWTRTFQSSNRLSPNERVIADSASIRSLLLFTSFIPVENMCSPNSGESFFYAVDLATGTASPFGALGFNGEESIVSTSLGVGRASFPLILNSVKGNIVPVIFQKDTGELVREEVNLGLAPGARRLNWREILNQ